MIPHGISFHDAVIADIRCEGKKLVFAMEDVVVEDGEEITPGLLTFEDVKVITLDGDQVPALDMAGDDGEISELHVLAGPVVTLSVIWTEFDSQDETEHRYRIECGNVQWTPSD